MSAKTMPSAVNRPWLKPKAAARAVTASTLTLGTMASTISEPSSAPMLAMDSVSSSLLVPGLFGRAESVGGIFV